MKKLLSVKKLKVVYDSSAGKVHALRGISFNVKKGEIFGIAGESGAGKTTICRLLMGFMEKNAGISGQVDFNGDDLLKLNYKDLYRLYGRKIGFLPQSIASLNPLLTIGTHITETLKKNLKIKKKKILKKKAIYILDALEFSDSRQVYNSFPYQLSGGMNQRALLAIAFCCFPDLVIADEPFTGLDPDVQNRLLETVRILKDKKNISMVIVTHDLKVIEKICDKTAIIYNGSFVETGETKDVIKTPLHPYTQSLIKAMPENGMIPTWGFAPGALYDDAGCSFQPRCPTGSKEKKKHIINSPASVGNNHYVWCLNVKNQESVKDLL